MKTTFCYRLRLVSLIVIVFLQVIGGRTAVREIVRIATNINTTPNASNPSSLTIINDELYFVADDGTHSVELWKTDGTNVTRLTDIAYGSAPSLISSLALYQGEIYFRAGSITNGFFDLELWKTDGTSTVLVANIRPGTSGSSPNGLTVYNDVLYFQANDGTTGSELWAYNGVNAYQVANINPGTNSSNPSGFRVYNGILFFTASNNIYGTELYTYDGSNLGVVDINPGSTHSKPSGYTEFNGLLYFQATDSTGGDELWYLNGANLAYGRVADIRSGTNGSSPTGLTVYNGALYFAANDGVNGSELWRYDGVNAPVRVTQIYSGSGSSSPANLCVFNGALYFAANEVNTGTELWKFDGTNATAVTNLNPSTASSSPTNLRAYKNHLYFSAMTTTRELWRYDGTTVSQFADVNLGDDGSFPDLGAVYDGAIYFRAGSSNGANTFFYKFDGSTLTTASTSRYPDGSMAVFNGALYLPSGNNLFKYDGTNFTSVGGFPGSSFNDLKAVNGSLYLTGDESATGRELYRYNGTNITRVSDIFPGAADSYPWILTEFKGALYFAATNLSGWCLWKCEGTNVSRVGNLIFKYPNITMLVYNDALYMGGATNGIDFEPWRWDGTNLTLVAQINPFQTNSGTSFVATNHNVAYFRANDGTHGYEFWKYDGTNATRIPAVTGATLYLAFSFNDAVYFMGDDGITGVELWKFDGVNFSQVADINMGDNDSIPMPMGEFNGSFYFTAYDALYGNELFRLDPISQVFRFTSITRQGNNIALSWTSPGGMTNILQSTSGGAGGISNNFADRSVPLLAPTGAVVTVNYTDVGGATNVPARYYRLRAP